MTDTAAKLLKLAFAWCAHLKLKNVWSVYWALGSSALPEFVNLILKGTVLFLMFMTCTTYFTAWWIYDMPIGHFHPMFVIMYTLIMTFVQLPILAIRLVLEAPTDLSHSAILKDVWMIYIQCYSNYMLFCALTVVAIIGYWGWLLKLSLHYRSSQCVISCRLAWIILSVLILTFLGLLMYVIIPFFWEVYNDGWATAVLKALWRLCAWLVPDPKAPSSGPRNRSSNNANVNGFNHTETASHFGNHSSTFNQQKHSTENPRAYSPGEEEKGAGSWVGYFKGEPKPEKKPEPLGSMSPRQAMFETRQVDKALYSQTEQKCAEAHKAVAEALQKDDSLKLAESLGRLHMCKTIQTYQKEASYQKTEIAAATNYGREVPTNTTEAWNNMLGVASEQAGVKLGDAGVLAAHHVAKHGLGEVADVIFGQTKSGNDEPQTPRSPRGWDEVV